jgi:hypothetical protein
MKLAVAFVVVLAVAESAAFPQNATSANPNQPAQTILCRALEVKSDPKTALTVALFHQASKGEGPALGELLRNNEGASVEFSTSDGQLHKVTLFRLDTCFGRGLLVFPSATSHLKNHERFSLRAAARAADEILTAKERVANETRRKEVNSSCDVDFSRDSR